MKIINLIENTSGENGCLYEHGLSFYIETEKHKLLFDAGASDAFIKNAEKLDVDLTQIDTVILSHGHYDHSGGILAFSEINNKANIYMQEKAGEDYYHLYEDGEKYIGIDKEILELPNVHLLKGDCRIDEELFLFTGVKGRKFWAKSNLELKCKTQSGFVQDEFEHEQCLVVTHRKKKILLSGCAHNGILNILDTYKEYFLREPDMVISGFHMMQKQEFDLFDIKNIQQTAQELKKMETVFYTGHCTGEKAFAIMKKEMDENLFLLHSGMEVEWE